jgi:hypothetical protein
MSDLIATFLHEDYESRHLIRIPGYDWGFQLPSVGFWLKMTSVSFYNDYVDVIDVIIDKLTKWHCTFLIVDGNTNDYICPHSNGCIQVYCS